MKTIYFSLISLAVLSLAVFSCQKAPGYRDVPSAPMITIQASIPTGEVTTRVAPVIPEDGKGLDWNWESGDQIAVVSGDNASVFDIRPGFEARQASFIGKQVSGSAFSILYPGTCASVAEMEAISLADQQQVGNASVAHLRYFALLGGVDDYKSFEFSPAWAASHGGSLKQSGAIRFQLTLPEETVVVSRISLKASSPVFHKSNAEADLTDELSIGIAEGALGSDHTITAWMVTSWFDDVIPAGTELTVNVAAGDFSWVRTLALEQNKTVKSGYVNAFTLDGNGWVTGGRYADGDGSEENPWLIKTPKQLNMVRDDIVAGEMRYFKLAADIDMAGLEWSPLNNADPYDKLINFDGDGHTISNLTITDGAAYASFAGVLYGEIKNITFNHASIEGGSGNKCAIVAGYVGTSAALAPCAMTNVEVKNSTLSGARSMGVIAGQVATADALFSNCHVYNTTVTQTATSTSHAGGFVGYAQAAALYSDCSSNATVEGTEFTGGFAGYIGKGTFSRCFASGEVSGTKHVGGFVGKTEDPTIIDCWYDGIQITATDNSKNAQSGGFVGNAAKFAGVFTGCYVKGTTIEAASGQRIGGFVGQSDLGNTFTKCYVQDVTLNAGANSAGFVGVDYANVSGEAGGIYQCYVEGGSITANANNAGGFVAYPEGAVIQNCYTTMDVNGGSCKNIGGFIGDCKGNAVVRYCYAAGAVTGTSGPIGAFAGIVEGTETTHVNYCIAWNDSLPFEGKITGGDVSNNYVGMEGTLAGQAAALGWDPAIWDFAAKLK